MSEFYLCVRSLVVVSVGPSSVFRLPFPTFVNSVFSRCSIVFVFVRYLVGPFRERFRFGIIFA